MDYQVTVFLPSNFERSEYLPHLNKHGKELAQMGGRVCWATDNVDFDSLTMAYENHEISWFGVSPVPKSYPKKWIIRHDSADPINPSSYVSKYGGTYKNASNSAKSNSKKTDC